MSAQTLHRFAMGKILLEGSVNIGTKKSKMTCN